MTGIGERVRDLRRSKGLSQEALAPLVGCSVKTIQRYEQGREKPRRDLLERLAEVLGTTPAWIEYGMDVGPEATSLRSRLDTSDADPEYLELVDRVAGQLNLEPDVVEALRATQWSSGLPSMNTLVSYAIDLRGSRSGKLPDRSEPEKVASRGGMQRAKKVRKPSK